MIILRHIFYYLLQVGVIFGLIYGIWDELIIVGTVWIIIIPVVILVFNIPHFTLEMKKAKRDKK